MTVALVVGARPQFVKAAALLPALRDRGPTLLVHTGQHTDAELDADQFASLGLPAPDVRLTADGDRDARRTGMVEGLRAAFAEHAIERVVVLGDTDSTVAGAEAAHALGLPLTHVEAGARSGEPDLPEEINRVRVDELSDRLLCSTAAHADNLAGRTGVHVVGDLMAAALQARAETIRAQAPSGGDPYAVLTVHRAGTADDPAALESIVQGLAGIGMRVVFPKHPRVQRRDFPAPIVVVPPMPYLAFLSLVAGATRVLTDSGGLQKEAYLLGVPCITLRDATEWGETVDAGWNVLAGTDPVRIREALAHTPPPARPALYGESDVPARIANHVWA
ncbi:MAG: UDP-N-acetylglucosamine 2-epimerase [Planctomycetota bacterium]